MIPAFASIELARAHRIEFQRILFDGNDILSRGLSHRIKPDIAVRGKHENGNQDDQNRLVKLHGTHATGIHHYNFVILIKTAEGNNNAEKNPIGIRMESMLTD